MTFVLSEKTKQHIDHWLKKYPADQRRSAIIASLLTAQEQNNGYLSEKAMNAVADYLQIPRVEAYEVATFYDMYHLKPIGKHKIAVCTNISCMLRGSDEILAHFKKKLGISPGETTSDGKFTLREVECLAACGGAPMCQMNDREYIEHLTIEKIDALIEKCE
ncbi:MAG: NADH dehydrogenase (ubiquinone), E subunit [uncultured bacterium]|nr:MAG: NADH dehydrogenase (ubiquinone), E subunit [uncultured bacterium]OGT26716.1 MAG: NADH dehydrogenase [Gammaproteobacteria bacterium RIFCSPHIGHO2_02_FULL_42_43]OGT27302.1 MAG: NADH dehydrogenase [Gammaproteobacteria bacterium RIFCSPHIGHO2_01_FULL_42_8]OGT52976.1 MAG: NADH dehydrogenase [Gammaproteobacteria bacterium RIFCSPHIGHO2_12_FULL_41_25]OGT61250.1 MAG: NADH dehydrogenase [Gammaproteobacteria bacterium RIFCSPLOWO2_02_FULL_42_14]OGT87179.1 MAG: NADH dehydrogenase [Gammaproteobacteria